MNYLRLFFLSLLFFGMSPLWARPAFVDKPPVEDQENRYYVGRASGKASDSEQQLFQQATLDARDTAIAEQFGVLTGIDRQSYQSLNSATSVERVSELSKRVIVRGFQKVDQFIAEDSQQKHIWLLFKYPKNEIAKELSRLERLGAPDLTPHFSEVSAPGANNGGYLELITSPPESSVTIDGQSFGLTPIRVRLAAGPHTVFVDNPHFHHFEEEVIIEPGKSTQLNKIMTRSMRKIVIKTTPPQASVSLGGKYIGLSPVETEVPAGERQTLIIEHPETQTYSITIEVGKGSTPHHLNIPNLLFKPSYLSINSAPQGADVFIDKVHIGKTPTGFIEARSGRLKISLPGHLDHEEDLQLRGGERRVLPTIQLVSIPEVELKRQADEKNKIERLTNSPWVVSLGLGYSSAPIKDEGPSLMSFHLSLERKFLGWFGLKVLLALHNYEESEDDRRSDQGPPNSSKDIISKMNASEWSAQLPIYLTQKLYLTPEYGQLSGEIETTLRTYNAGGFTNYDGDPLERKYKQNFWGVHIGYTSFGEDTKPWGFYGELGYRKFSDDNSYKGESAFSGRLGLGFRF